MPGPAETLPESATWNADLLKFLFEQRINAIESAIDKAFASTEKATDKSERDIERWREANNEWRSTLVDREVKFLLIETFNARMTAVDTRAQMFQAAITELRTFRDISLALAPRLDGLEKQLDELTDWKNKQLGKQQAQTLIIAGIFAIITVALRFVG